MAAPQGSSEEADRLVGYVRRSIIGRHDLIEGPYGPRPMIYADYTASGRSLSFIEDYVRHAVLPLYANTHSESSGSGRQTTQLREEARSIIAEATGAGSEYAVVFCGSGATHAIAKIIGVLGLTIPSNLDDRYRFTSQIPAEERPVVFVGPYEHHSNELPWRESIAEVIPIDEDADGHLDIDQLEAALLRHSDRPLLIGSFSAASNVTGILTDTARISTLLHAHGALAFWDYAAAAPYVEIDVDMSSDGDGAYADAIFFSPHKFVGGPGTPGVLIARRELFTNRVPVVPGGGTVTYVSPTEHNFDPRIEHREEGGTPAIVESIRAGLAMQLKMAVGVEEIQRRERALLDRAMSAWSTNPAIEILGDLEADRLSIVSLVIGHEQGFLHHNFVVALLNDLFGIQARGGCSCAGPYGHRLLRIDPDRSHEFQREIGRGCEGIKPGWTRVSFNYFFDDATLDYLIEAVDLVAELGHRLLPHYRFEPDTGLWRHRSEPPHPPHSLHDVSYRSGAMHYLDRRIEGTPDFDDLLDQARRLANQPAIGSLEPPATTVDFEHLRWFPYPADVS